MKFKFWYSKKYRSEFYTHYNHYKDNELYSDLKKFMVDYDQESIEIYRSFKMFFLILTFLLLLTSIILIKFNINVHGVLVFILSAVSFLYYRHYKLNEILFVMWKELTISIYNEMIQNKNSK